MGFSTDAVHGGQEPEKMTGAVMSPIFQTSTYKQDGLGDHRGYEYGRTQNPTREALERNIAVLERGEFAVAFASGMSAIDAVLRLFEEGDEIIVTNNVYGGTYRLFEMILKKFGLKFNFIDTSNLDILESTINAKTRLIFVETPTNPVLSVTDIRAVTKIARAHNILFAVDNTFMSPYFQNPTGDGRRYCSA